MVLSRPDILSRFESGSLVIEPPVHGNITLEMANFGKVPVDLRAGIDQPAQLMLLQLTTPLGDAEAYGAGTADHFQNQTDPIPRR